MEEEIKQLLGDSYQEGMSGADIQEAFNKMLLASGKYVNKDNADAQQRKLESDFKKQIADLNTQLSSKMTEDEKEKAAQKQRDAEFEEMKKLLAQSRFESSESNFRSNISEAKRLAGIEEEDNDFSEFVSNATSEDKEKSDKISKYINNLVKKAYEKGKADGNKDALGNMGKDGKGSQGEGDGLSDAEQKVKDIIAKQAKTNTNYYFK